MSSRAARLIVRRCYSTKLNFDKTKYVDMLTSEGLNANQATGLVSLVEEAVYESMSSVSRNMVTKQTQESNVSLSNADITSIRSDISNLEKKDYASLRKDLDHISAEVSRIKSTLVDDLSRVHGGTRLDVNLEKARIHDEASELGKTVSKAEERINEQMGILSERIKRVRYSTRQFMMQIVGIAVVLVGGYKYSIMKNPPKEEHHSLE